MMEFDDVPMALSGEPLEYEEVYRVGPPPPRGIYGPPRPAYLANLPPPQVRGGGGGARATPGVAACSGAACRQWLHYSRRRPAPGAPGAAGAGDWTAGRAAGAPGVRSPALERRKSTVAGGAPAIRQTPGARNSCVRAGRRAALECAEQRQHPSTGLPLERAAATQPGGQAANRLGRQAPVARRRPSA